MTGGPDHEPIELKATSAVLAAAAFLIGSRCKTANDSYMLCRKRHADPSSCVGQGESVFECITALFEALQASPCRGLFEQYWTCLDMNNQDYIYCRDEEISFHRCTKESLVIDRWVVGSFGQGVEKRLWKAQGPEGGLKEAHELPGHDTWQYRYHVWKNKS